VHDSKPPGTAVGPLKVVEETPHKIAPNRCAVRDRPLELLEVAAKIFNPVEVQAFTPFTTSSSYPHPFSPPHDIEFGPNSTDEMCELQLGLIPLNLGEEKLLLEARVLKMKEKVAELTPEQRGRFHWSDAFNDLSGPE